MATWPRVQLFYILYVFLKVFLFAHRDFFLIVVLAIYNWSDKITKYKGKV